MNKGSAFRSLPALTLTAVLVVVSCVVRVVTCQEKTGAGEVTEAKPSPGGGKTATGKPAATPEPAAEQTWGPYGIYSSVEFGVRGMSVDGNGNKFRSDYNYDPGFKLFDASLLMKSNGGRGVLFDELMLNTFGWSGDPNRH